MLDIGAGYGIDILTLIENSPVESSYYIALEIASSQVLSMKKEFRSRNITNVDFVVGDGTRLPLADDSIDIVISNQTIEHISAQENHLQESYRVLKKGGVLLITTGNRVFPFQGNNHTPLPFLPWLPWNFALRLLRLLYYIHPERINYYYHVYLLSTLYLEKLLKKCGFETDFVTLKLLADTQALLTELSVREKKSEQVIAKLIPPLLKIPLSKVLIKFSFPYTAFIGINN